MKILLILLVCFVFVTNMGFLKVNAQEGFIGFNEPTSEVMPENRCNAKTIHWIRIVNDFNGPIEISYDKGGYQTNRSWTSVGKVLRPAVSNNPFGYRASGWANVGTVAASAVNAIHIKVGHDDQVPAFPTGRGVLVSILPRWSSPAPSVILTNIPFGMYIFSKELAPFINNNVYLEKNESSYNLHP